MGYSYYLWMGETATHNMVEYVPPSKWKSQSLISKDIASLQQLLEAPTETRDSRSWLHTHIDWFRFKKKLKKIIIIFMKFEHKELHLWGS